MIQEYAKLDAIIPRGVLLSLRGLARRTGRSESQTVADILIRHLSQANGTSLSFNPDACESVELDNLPSTPGVYFVFDGRVLYVGKAANLRARWADHRLREATIERGWRLLFKAIDERFPTVESEEAAWIASLKPPLNRNQPSGLRGVQ